MLNVEVRKPTHSITPLPNSAMKTRFYTIVISAFILFSGCDSVTPDDANVELDPQMLSIVDGGGDLRGTLQLSEGVVLPQSIKQQTSKASLTRTSSMMHLTGLPRVR